MYQGYESEFEADEGVGTVASVGGSGVGGMHRQACTLTGAALAMMVESQVLAANTRSGKPQGFTGIAIAANNTRRAPPEYEGQMLCRWDDVLESQTNAALFKFDGSTTWEEQALQAGMHMEGMAFFPIDGNLRHGLLSINQKYTDEEPLYLTDVQSLSADQVYEPRASHGVRVIEIIERLGRWHVLPRLRSARLSKSSTLIDFGGVTSAHASLQSVDDFEGCVVTCSAFTPDRRFVFINVRQPEQRAGECSNLARAPIAGDWPDSPGGRLRSATVVIRRRDGGAVGT
jgi:uncharacterized protein